MSSSGTLYLVGTPIGNLGDLSPRALEILGSVDFIAAEDTRVTRGLLTHFGLSKPLVSYYEQNARDSGEKILARLLAGQSCALVTDAGMPAISDPGEALVALAAERGIPIAAVPGPTALATALALSGLPTQRFCFEGFLSMNKRQRREHLKALQHETRAIVFYEAPHKLQATLADLFAALGNRRCAIARELTKLYEEMLRCTLSEAIDHFAVTPPRGEFVLVIEGRADTVEHDAFPEALTLASGLVADGVSVSDAAKRAAETFHVSRNKLYRALSHPEHET
ncbi:16S rRNA (cytidine(1402)-2'-O)-methyltransferase [Oscillospiraceae bacterium OttesenSCG-928-F05]|nr:16S rRNA (cytidine(1402)-2'-O)-methyltransferase [Oscillospiraceae bacterium OttesenSCG-928-F05]